MSTPFPFAPNPSPYLVASEGGLGSRATASMASSLPPCAATSRRPVLDKEASSSARVAHSKSFLVGVKLHVARGGSSSRRFSAMRAFTSPREATWTPILNRPSNGTGKEMVPQNGSFAVERTARRRPPQAQVPFAKMGSKKPPGLAERRPFRFGLEAKWSCRWQRIPRNERRARHFSPVEDVAVRRRLSEPFPDQSIAVIAVLVSHHDRARRIGRAWLLARLNA